MVYREYKVSLRRLWACLVYLPQTGSSLVSFASRAKPVPVCPCKC